MARLMLVVCVTNSGSVHLNMIDAGVHSRMSVGRCAEAISCRGRLITSNLVYSLGKH